MSTSTRTAVYPGSFDPITNGHLDVVRHAVRLADRLVIAIGVHPLLVMAEGKGALAVDDLRLEELGLQVRVPVQAGTRLVTATMLALELRGMVRQLPGPQYLRR